MMLVPLRALPAQVQTVTLSSQRVTMAVREKHLFESVPGTQSDFRQTTPQRAEDGTVTVYDQERGRVIVKRPALFLDLAVNDRLILAGALCLEWTRLVRDAYFGFVGDLAFKDMQGSADPVSSGLGSRWFLFYMFPQELK
jgi:hypothetical protein